MSKETQQTAVEQFWDKIALKLSVEQVLEFMPLLEQAKEMEKEQIIVAASDHCYPTCELATIDAEQYYNETYGGNK